MCNCPEEPASQSHPFHPNCTFRLPALNVSSAHSVRTILPLASKIPALVSPP